MSTQTPPTGTGAGKASSGRGALEICLCWMDDDRRLCALPANHAGTHLAFPRWPQTDVSADNPNVRSKK